MWSEAAHLALIDHPSGGPNHLRNCKRTRNKNSLLIITFSRRQDARKKPKIPKKVGIVTSAVVTTAMTATQGNICSLPISMFPPLFQFNLEFQNNPKAVHLF